VSRRYEVQPPDTRSHIHTVELAAPPQEVFPLLVTPSAIRQWWYASRAIVMAREGGAWMAAWGDDEDHPDFMTAALIRVYDPPRRILLADFRYYARTGPLPFRAFFTTEFTVEPRPGGSLLRVVQDGFPTESIADEFYEGCERGWRETFESIRRFVAEHLARIPLPPAASPS
jgi:uncharacterized protein YndB with AHSA1/START domain